ncbi:MAG TPA: DUF1697 domain-containing protein [Gemmatimonadales bacterium]|nr:DUF1697 domain-containing protein [Gemmatimonadales bacterium]
MPQRCIALLRGVNLGGNKKVPMAELRRLVEGLGFTDVRTLLNSGNVVFTARANAVRTAAARIQQAVLDQLGVSSKVTVLTAEELGAILDENPIAGLCDNPSRMLVAVFAEEDARSRAVRLAEQRWEPEVMAVGKRAAYLWCVNGISAGQLGFAVDKALKTGVTARNLGTMTKLRAMAEAGAM